MLREGDLAMVEIALNGEPVEALSFVTHRSNAETQGRVIAKKLKEVIDRQNFEIVIQAKIGIKVLARERVAPYRKDVLTLKSGKTAGGGDITRKKKLLGRCFLDVCFKSCFFVCSSSCGQISEVCLH